VPKKGDRVRIVGPSTTKGMAGVVKEVRKADTEHDLNVTVRLDEPLYVGGMRTSYYKDSEVEPE
jgi:hypothetical protein